MVINPSSVQTNQHKYLQNVYNTSSIPQWCLDAFLTNS